jgi:serine/threonine protein kinase
MLSDFGVSRIVVEGVTITETTSLKGSLRYMAPELLEESPTNSKQQLHTKESDVWAFGMVVYVSYSYAHVHKRVMR